MRTGAKLYKGDQTRRRLSKNGEKATLWEQKRTASERQDLQSIRFISGGSRAYLKCRKAYGIMPVGENDRSAHVAQQKAPEVATPGLFYSVLGGWLNPKAGYQLFFSVQPFADVVGNYTCQNREKK